MIILKKIQVFLICNKIEKENLEEKAGNHSR